MFKKSLGWILIFALLTGCQTIKKEVSKDPLAVYPESKPVPNITDFNEAIKCMDEIVGAELNRRNKDLVLTSDDINTAISGISGMEQSVKEMLISVISEMSEKNRRIKFIALDLKDVNTKTSFTLHKMKEKKDFAVPDYFIRGAITVSEKDVSKGGKDVGLGVPKIASLDYSKTKSMWVVALSLNIVRIDNFQIVPGVTSNNIMALYKQDEALNINAGYIDKAEGSYSIAFRDNEGMSAAIHKLIQLGTIELIGKLLNIPYDNCLVPSKRKEIMGMPTSSAMPELPLTPASKAVSVTSINAGFVYRSGGKGEPTAIQKGSTLQSGDCYKIVLKPVQDCYLYIFQADSAGQFLKLFPLQSFNGLTLNQSNPIRQGKAYVLPAPDKSFELDSNTGIEKIYLIASNEPNAELENLYNEITSAKNSVQKNNANSRFRNYIEQKRGIKDVVSDPIQVPFQETKDIFTVMGRKLEGFNRDQVYMLEFNHR